VAGIQLKRSSRNALKVRAGGIASLVKTPYGTPSYLLTFRMILDARGNRNKIRNIVTYI